MGWFTRLLARWLRSINSARLRPEEALDHDLDQRAATLIERLQSSPDDSEPESEFTDSPEIPVGKWLRIKFRMCPSFIGYTYVEGPQLSAKGSYRQDPRLAEAPSLTIRLPNPAAALWRLLSPEEVNRLRLPTSPSWLEFYGHQPAPGTVWRPHDLGI